ncbi:hypothetical protein V5N11_000492 [Cardamine amara subsp. amara]|uniref:GCK domain-containing protein n=1 Tax=Cardamine amara subsp. amara TaxID=228776 RepID=A0ABD1B763_CARAN
MGITSSTESNSQNDRFPWGRFPWDRFPWDELEEREGLPVPDKELDATVEASCELAIKELDAILPPKQGESSTNKPKEEREEEVLMRFNEFMKGGGCKESVKAMEDCVEKTQSIIPDCIQPLRMLFKCMDAHSRYYQPIITLAESTMEQVNKKIDEQIEREEQAEA